MTCSHVQYQLTRYLERMCDKSDVATIARHIESCPVCAQQLMELQRVKSFMRQVRDIDPNPFLMSEIMTSIRERTTHRLPEPERHGKRTFWRRRARYMIAAAAAVILTATTMTWHLINPPPPPVAQSPHESDDMTIYLQEHALQSDQNVFTNGAFGSVMVSGNGKK